jgi:hypothetical protein
MNRTTYDKHDISMPMCACFVKQTSDPILIELSTNLSWSLRCSLMGPMKIIGESGESVGQQATPLFVSPQVM